MSIPTSTAASVVSPIASFKDLSLPESLEKALKLMNYDTPTPIQSQGIPVAMTGRDMIGCAQTGTGKTAAFCIPLIANLLKSPQKTALILTPTRELAEQIQQVLFHLTSQNHEIKLALLIGGASYRTQMSMIARGPRIIVATPGRLMDHLRRKTVSLAQAEFLVLDEADRMLDMGFEPQLREILKHIPRERQTLLFSATLPPDIQKLASQYLKNPLRVSVGSASKPVLKIKQSIVETTVGEKNNILLGELNTRQGSVLIFARTKKRTDRLTKYLLDYGYKTDLIHGDRSQKQRSNAIEGFRSGHFRILVATDVAARGIDIPHIAHVINYDLPQQPEDYVHRIGRTGRAGAEGEALSFVTPEDRRAWMTIAKFADGPEAKSRPARRKY